MSTTSSKRGERTRLVKEYLSQNPDASKKEVMEKFSVSDATFYNIRKQLLGETKRSQKATRSKNLINSVKEKASRASKAVSSDNCASISIDLGSSAAIDFRISMNNGSNVVLHATEEGLVLSKETGVKVMDTVLTWDTFFKLQSSGLLSR